MSLSDVSVMSHARRQRFVFTPGQVIGDRYLLEEPIGEGGMGVVYRARHLALGTPVAIKLIRPDMKDDPECVRRFLNEARRAAALRSERIARVHDVGQLESGEPYLVMELLEGVDLARYSEKWGPLAQAEVVAIVLQICEGLAEAHAAGMVHRDVKPANVFLSRRVDGQLGVKLLDFGISKQFNDESPSSLTGHDESLGSPWYMSPEQMTDPSNVDPRSDVWSVGVVLFELLTGKRPFDGHNVPEICAKVLTAPAPSLGTWIQNVDPALDALVQKCFGKHPDDRFHDILALGTALQGFAGTPTAGMRVTPTDFFAADVQELPPSGRKVPYADRKTPYSAPKAPDFDSKAWFESPARYSNPDQSLEPSRVSSSGLFVLDPAPFDSTAPLTGPSIPATPTLRRRVRRAHVLGVLGVLGVVALLGFAVVRGAEDPQLLAGSPLKSAAARVPGVATKVEGVLGRFGHLPTFAPPLAAGPEPAPLDRGNEAFPLLMARTAPVSDTTNGLDATDETDGEEATESADDAGWADDKAAKPAKSENISAAEVRARLTRYEAWLREEGLVRVTQPTGDPPFMSEP